jgi:hypothetical protein
MPMTNRQKAIIIGLLLGDGHLEQNGRFVRLKVDQALKHSDYVNWLYNELKGLVPAHPVIIRENDKRTHKIYARMHFSTYSNVEFKKWRNDFYVDRKKIVPPKIKNILNSVISLAIWLMDDGYKRNDCAAIRLNTDAFNYNEQQLLVDCLHQNFQIKSQIHKKGKWYNIYIPKGEANKFCQLAKPYILPSFKHKLL